MREDQEALVISTDDNEYCLQMYNLIYVLLIHCFLFIKSIIFNILILCIIFNILKQGRWRNNIYQIIIIRNTRISI